MFRRGKAHLSRFDTRRNQWSCLILLPRRRNIASLLAKREEFRAVGIGGVFFRAADVPGLAEWYEKHLGIHNLHKSVWQQDAGMTIFGPFARDSDYFGRAEQQWMISMPSSRSSRTKV